MNEIGSGVLMLRRRPSPQAHTLTDTRHRGPASLAGTDVMPGPPSRPG